MAVLRPDAVLSPRRHTALFRWDGPVSKPSDDILEEAFEKLGIDALAAPGESVQAWMLELVGRELPPNTRYVFLEPRSQVPVLDVYEVAANDLGATHAAISDDEVPAPDTFYDILEVLSQAKRAVKKRAGALARIFEFLWDIAPMVLAGVAVWAITTQLGDGDGGGDGGGS